MKTVKNYISAHPAWAIAVFALFFPMSAALIYVCAFQIGKAYDIAILRYQGLFQLVCVAVLPAIFFMYALKPLGQKYFALSILLGVLYAPLSMWCTVAAYFTITCKVFGSCSFP